MIIQGKFLLASLLLGTATAAAAEKKKDKVVRGGDRIQKRRLNQGVSGEFETAYYGGGGYKLPNFQAQRARNR